MLATISNVIDELNRRGIRYCHWKSNYSLAQTVLGQTDVDLLIDRRLASQFRAILVDHGFRPVVNTDGESFPSVEHYYTLDEESGNFVHVHAYYRVITGESLAKNYRFPIEEMLLENTREQNGIRVPTKAAELITFTLRILLKHTSLVELTLLSRYWGQAKEEIRWLAEGDAPDAAVELVNRWLPAVGGKFFAKCVEALRAPASLWRRIRLGHRLRARLRVYARHSPIRAWLGSVRTFTGMSIRRFVRSKKNMVPQCGGAVIAFVGPEASGKSTLISEIGHWLGSDFAVETGHAGKPAPTILTSIPAVALPLLRKALPDHRTSAVETRYADDASEEASDGFPLIYGIRSVMVAHDRRALLTRLYSHAANGTIVLCDRYPSLQSGAPDSPQLAHLSAPSGRYSLRRQLARVESRMYKQIPPPDLVIQLSAPLDVAVSRNSTRDKTEPEDYVRRRYVQSTDLDFGRTSVYRVSTDRSLEDTVRQVKEIIWDYL